jgi:hypothetical protein
MTVHDGTAVQYALSEIEVKSSKVGGPAGRRPERNGRAGRAFRHNGVPYARKIQLDDHARHPSVSWLEDSPHGPRVARPVDLLACWLLAFVVVDLSSRRETAGD